MRKVKTLAFALRVIGIVVLCLALVFTIYSVCSTGTRWNQAKGYLESKGVKTNLFDKVYQVPNYEMPHQVQRLAKF